MAAPPRRLAAIEAERINKLEIESGLLPDADGADSSDEDYVSDDESNKISSSSFSREKDVKGNEQALAHARARAEVLFAGLDRPGDVAKRLVGELRREERNEDAKKIKRDERWVDPMLRKSLGADVNEMNIEFYLDMARKVMDTTGRTTVEESVKFAGETVTIQKSVDKQELAQAALAEQEKQRSTLDDFVDGITKKRGVTTVEKSSFDWEKYKQEKKLEEELQDASKAGFVEKQAFLNRVDERQFEAERTVRERERAARDAAAPKRASAD